MQKKSTSRAGFFNFRVFLALALCWASVLLALSSFAPQVEPLANGRKATAKLERDMPVPGGERGEASDLNRMEEEWNNRLTYPTGLFNPAWLRAAAAQDSLLRRAIPVGIPFKSASVGKSARGLLSPLALSSSGFTALGPGPLQMTGCSGCYDYTKTEGRVNAIAVDPTTTTNGNIVAYLASVGGGVWKTTNCCSSSTIWTATTDNPLLSTISVDTLAIDPNNHNTIS